MSIHPTEAQLKALPTRSIAGPVVMLNLLRFAGEEGRQSYARYGEGVLPFLQEVGAKLLVRLDARQLVIGPEDEQWDELLLVEYPSLNAFLTMAMDPEYQEVARHRTAALSDSRLVACTHPSR